MYKAKIIICCFILMLLAGCANAAEPEVVATPMKESEKTPVTDLDTTQEPMKEPAATPIQQPEIEPTVKPTQEPESEPTAKPLKEVVKRSVSEQDIAIATEKFAAVRVKAETLIHERPELTEAVYDKNYITRMDERLISFISGHTFDTVTGQELAIEDVIADKEVFWNSTKASLLQKVEAGITELPAKRYASDYKEIIAGMDENTADWYFYMDATGICFYFLEETIYEYPMKYTVSYEELSGGLKEEYFPGNGPIIARMSCEYSVEPQEGVSVCLDAEILGTSGYSGEGVCLAVNNSEYNLYEEGYYLYYGYLMKRPDERIFLILCMDYASDDYNTVVFEVTDGVIQKCDGYSGARFELQCGDFENIQLQVTMWILGVRTGMMNCKLTENGMLEKQSEIFQTSDILTTKKELPVMLEGEEKLLPIGTQIELTGTNGEDVVYFTLQESGQSGEIHFDISAEDYGTPLIDGIEEYAYFDGLIYAG